MKFNPPKDEESDGEKRTVRKFALFPTLLGNMGSRKFTKGIWLEMYNVDQVWRFYHAGPSEYDSRRNGWQWIDVRKWQD